MKLISADNNIYYAAECGINNLSILKIDGKEYYRFCDFIYIPAPTNQLSTDQVKTISEIREKVFLDYNQFKINFKIRDKFKQIIQICDPKTLLEFGPGKTPLLKKTEFDQNNLFLADLRKGVIDHLKKTYINCLLFDKTSNLNIEDNSIDCIVAIFVFHFYISQNQIKELNRVLNHSGMIIANVYKISKYDKNILLNRFLQEGFSCERFIDKEHLCKNHEYWFLFKNKSSTILSLIKKLFSTIN